MKEKELREHAECDLCHNKIGASKLPMFYVVKLTTYGLNLSATQRQQGLGLMIGGTLAMAMGVDEDLADEIDCIEKTVCFNCQGRLFEFMEAT